MEVWQQLLVSLLGGLLGGGIISAYFDWRRFRREQAEIKKEEQRVAIDPIRSVISVMPWQISDLMNDKLKLYIYEHNLQGSVQEYAIVVEFVIKNLTDGEVIITQIEVEEPGVPTFDFWPPEIDDAHIRVRVHGKSFEGHYIQPVGTEFRMYDMQGFYDWKTKEETKIESVTLKPKETLPLAYIAVRRFCAIRTLDKPPQSITVTVHSTGEHKITRVVELTEGRFFRAPNRVGKYKCPQYSVEWYWEEDAIRKSVEEARRKSPEEPPEEGEEILF